MPQRTKRFDAFLSHSHEDAEWVENLARKLEDTHGLRIWLDKWILVPGKSWQQAMAKGLDEASTCAVCIGQNTPRGWFREEIERALDLQTRDGSFRVIPVLLPNSDPDNLAAFLSLRTWVDFREGRDERYAFHVLNQGIKGEPVGRWPPNKDEQPVDGTSKYERKLAELSKFRTVGLHEEVVMEFERKILDLWLRDGTP